MLFVWYQGIDPKLEFSSNSTIQETTVPGTYNELTSVGHYEESSVDSEVRKDLIVFVIIDLVPFS